MTMLADNQSTVAASQCAEGGNGGAGVEGEVLVDDFFHGAEAALATEMPQPT